MCLNSICRQPVAPDLYLCQFCSESPIILSKERQVADTDGNTKRYHNFCAPIKTVEDLQKSLFKEIYHQPLKIPFGIVRFYLCITFPEHFVMLVHLAEYLQKSGRKA